MNLEDLSLPLHKEQANPWFLQIHLIHCHRKAGFDVPLLSSEGLSEPLFLHL